MKKLISVILSVVLCFSAFSVVAFAEEEITDPFTYTVDEQGFATLADCAETVEGDIIIPAIVETEDGFAEVKYIGDYAFENCSLITSITLSEGIEQIGNGAFSNCTALTDLYVPQTLLVCMYNAFAGCGALTLHCYSTNYQLLTVFGLISNLRIDIIDSTGDDMDLDMGMGSLGSVDMTNTIVFVIKRIIHSIIYFILGYFADSAPEAPEATPDEGTVTAPSTVVAY